MKKTILSLILITGFLSMVNAQVLIKVDGRAIPYNLFSSFKLPGAQLSLEVQNKQGGDYRVFLGTELKSTFKPGTYSMAVPSKAGLHHVRIVDANNKVIIDLNVFVLVPITDKKDGYLKGFRIGNYPPPLGEQGRYERPKGLIELNQALLETQVSPHFKLKQFAPKQKGKPQYMVLKESLLLKLEYILAEVNKAEVTTAKTFKIMEAYMTPHANAEAQNAIYSRHIYGDAVTFIIDKNQDGVMDDLNQDGEKNMKDVRLLFDLIDKLSARPDYQKIEGGLAHFKRSRKRSGYVYIDARGKKMRF